MDVFADGNCYLRAVSVCQYNNESGHLELRKSIVNHILELASAGDTLPGISMDVEGPSVRQELDNMMQIGTWAGEDMIATTAAFLRRPVQVYTFTSVLDASPLIYPSPVQQALDVHPIRVAFYLPGHYRAVKANNFILSFKLRGEMSRLNLINVQDPIETNDTLILFNVQSVVNK